MKSISILLGLIFIYSVGSGQRAAFLIGMGNYSHMDTLTNSARDADSMKAVLGSLGYKTFEVKNEPNAVVRDSFRTWFPLMRNYHDVVIYYSGHGFMLASSNEFLPLTDFDPWNSNSLKNVETLTIHKYYLLDSLKKISELPQSKLVNKVIILDACRDFPPKAADIKKVLEHLTLPQPINRRYNVGYSVQAGHESAGLGDRNSPATAAILNRLHSNPYDDADVFWNDTQTILDSIDNNKQVLDVDGPRFPWRFADIRSCPTCFTSPPPNTHFCTHCNAQKIISLVDTTLFGRGIEEIEMSLPPKTLMEIPLSHGVEMAFVSSFKNSLIAKHLAYHLDVSHIYDDLYDLSNSFLVYEFKEKKLATIEIYLKYRAFAFHRNLATTFGINLNEFPGFIYLNANLESSGLADEVAIFGPFIQGKTGAVFGRLAQYGYSIIEVGSPSELFADPYNLDKFRSVFHLLDKPKLPAYRN